MKSMFILFAVLVACEVFSQPIQIHKTLGGAHFQRDTLYLSHRHVSEILSVDPQASEEFKIALKNYRIGGIMGFGGAILLAVPLVTAFSGGEPEWIMAGGGAALLIGSIPFSRGFKNHAEAAIEGYNARHESGPQTRLYFSGSGITLKF
jgi:hypothetical protein